MWNCLLDYHGNRVQHTTLTYQPRTTDFRSRIRARLSWVGRNWVATGGHHFRGIVWRILGTTRRSNHALYPSGHFVRPVHHGHFDHLLFVTLSTFTGGPSTLIQFSAFFFWEGGRWCYYPVSESGTHLERMGIPTEPIHATAKRHAIYRASVRLLCPCP